MKAIFSLLMVLALVVIATVGAGAAQMQTIFAYCIPGTAFIIFLVGFACKIISWARRPVPFSIPTTGGQQQSLDWIKQNKWDNPSTGPQTFVRMALEVLTFRSLFRNTKTVLKHDDGQNPIVAYVSAKWLWLFAILFHYGFLIVVIRHMRLFMQPVPTPIATLDYFDSILQILTPTIYISDLLLIGGVSLLLLRRFFDAKVRFISLVNDYFPLFLILGIALSGVYMRYIAKVDIMSIKDVVMGLVAFNYKVPAGVDVSFFVHLFLVSTLLVYFPFSKLMHMGGVFLSPTRNMTNNTRMVHYENVWNDPNIKPHSYEAYENEFREPMHEAGLPLEKTPEEAA
ncbi:putative sulfite reductase-associated electron transfer protein DsrM [Humidesulfovibrio mexicanus]|uniref:Putative sulfite reductase-associated electron transfer protein DsrM n=1 Tax=Humidesulfovibrio mexicanus TaxID=147047 RepID=A0A239C460_9BACT|nr:sulfate reduction electron transfer complex DsrMKJOP subunit DsrM [Humidesulfovibrio mexicanus]SNS15047.1 putative sulfite reductase-associated electron transfer protein DsrM [Humidesulfovibrio mexicanus]